MDFGAKPTLQMLLLKTQALANKTTSSDSG